MGGLSKSAFSGDLDNARAYWSVVNGNLGRDTLGTTVDTFYSATNQGPILSAVNSCIRKYAAHLGIYAQDTVRVLDQTFVYTLGASYIEDATTAKPFKVYGVTSDNGTVYGLERTDKPTQLGNSVTMGPFPSLFDVVDDKLWINNPNKNDLLYFYGPIAGITFTDGADTTNVLEQDRSAICDCATSLVWDELYPGQGFGDPWWAKFESHIISRGGTTPSRGPEVPK